MFALFLSHEEMFTATQALDRTQENHARYGFNVMFKMVFVSGREMIFTARKI